MDTGPAATLAAQLTSAGTVAQTSCAVYLVLVVDQLDHRVELASVAEDADEPGCARWPCAGRSPETCRPAGRSASPRSPPAAGGRTSGQLTRTTPSSSFSIHSGLARLLVRQFPTRSNTAATLLFDTSLRQLFVVCCISNRRREVCFLQF